MIPKTHRDNTRLERGAQAEVAAGGGFGLKSGKDQGKLGSRGEVWAAGDGAFAGRRPLRRGPGGGGSQLCGG